MKKNNGITLIALVITIIVLLILAGVSIAMITSQDGILGKAKSAKIDNTLAEGVDQVNLKIIDLQTSYYQERYVDGTTTDEIDDYMSTKLEAAYPAASGKAGSCTAVYDKTTKKITLTYESQTKVGTLASGTITWANS